MQAGEWIPYSMACLDEIAADYVGEKISALDGILSTTDENALRDKSKEEQQAILAKAEQDIISTAKTSIGTLSALHGVEERRDALADRIALCLHRLSVRYYNLLQNVSEVLRLLVLALQFARTPSARATISADKDYVDYLALRNVAMTLTEQKKYKLAVYKLQAALELAPEDERKTIEEWITRCRQNQVLEGVDTTKNSPSLYTINGIGTTFYGRRDYDAATNSYVTTHVLTLLFFPVLPIGAYRVIDAGQNTYKILGKVPLSIPAIWYRRVVLGLGGVYFLVAAFQSETPRPMQSNKPPSVSVSRSENKAQEKEEIERLRNDLEPRQSNLKQRASEIQSLVSEMEGLKQEIRRFEQLYGYQMPPDVYPTYSNKVERHNVLVQRYNQRLGPYQTESEQLDRDIAEFNQRVERYNSRR